MSMSIASHTKRLKRLEAASDASEKEPLVFSLHEWAGCPPLRKEEADDERIAMMEAKALHRLVEAGQITDEDRDRVQFIVYVSVSPSRPEQLEPDGQ